MVKSNLRIVIFIFIVYLMNIGEVFALIIDIQVQNAGIFVNAAFLYQSDLKPYQLAPVPE